MPSTKKKVHATFNVGAMMSKPKEARERNALEHEKGFDLIKRLTVKTSQSAETSAKGE